MVDPNMFLKLLVASIQNQDPTNPSDPSKMLDQLASMSQVQQSIETNAMLSSLLDTLSFGQAATLIGREITNNAGESLGKVVAVLVTGDGLIARMADGTEVVLGPGMTVGP
jgi:flagellar basal-body rod modification protein FlgD